jgi:hypothetical protein
MKTISGLLISVWVCVYGTVYAQSSLEQYIKLFPELSLPYNLTKEKMNALKKEVKPIPKEYMLYTTSIKMRASSANSYEFMTYYPIGKITLSEKLVVLFVFENTGNSVFVYTHNTSQKDGEYKYFDNIGSLVITDDYLKIDNEKNIESCYFISHQAKYYRKMYKINSSGKVAFIKDL